VLRHHREHFLLCVSMMRPGRRRLADEGCLFLREEVSELGSRCGRELPWFLAGTSESKTCWVTEQKCLCLAERRYRPAEPDGLVWRTKPVVDTTGGYHWILKTFAVVYRYWPEMGCWYCTAQKKAARLIAQRRPQVLYRRRGQGRHIECECGSYLDCDGPGLPVSAELSALHSP